MLEESAVLSHGNGHGTLVQIAVRGDPAPMGETRATTSASISELRGLLLSPTITR